MTTPTYPDLRDKVFLVSGAAGGVGRAQALALAQQGAVVAMLDLSSLDSAANEVARLGGRYSRAATDVRDAQAVSRIVADVVEQWGRLDGVLATAGVCRGYGPFWQVDEHDMRFTVETNVYGTWNLLSAAADHWVGTRTTGAVVVTGSVAAARGLPSVGHYVMSKHAQLGLVRTAARELGPYGIRVNAVAPTNVDTPMFQRAAVWQIVAGRGGSVSRDEAAAAALDSHHLPIPWVEPDDVAAASTWLLSAAARYVTGAVLAVDAGALDH
ncbi:SDR family oxidoreductase [Pedococcus sp. 5OH_020]|uniref:SDR family oxidoreductase n=1 Tax=Pedococcus sp. 5OH_020 TaxID=2989814 RepID=UPI0022E9BDA1|nr:SDR family oxidoreductase [Pedococcus sp. 5OH_020]